MSLNICSSLILIAATCALPALAAPCVREAPRNVALDASGATKIVITAGAGDLQIKGERGRRQIMVTGEACASDQELLDKIQLEGRRDGSTIIVKAVLPEAKGFLGYARLDLNIALPENIALSVQDSSGHTTIQDVGALALTDSSGDVVVRNVRGDMSLNDSSGDIEIQQVSGRLSLTDGSGDIKIVQVGGEVEIGTDSSGNIRIEKAGSVHIVSDSSGDIVISEVQGDVLIDEDSSGDITVNGVGGKFTVRSDSSGSISKQRVNGAVNVPAR
jgi:hypothetical protein